jgi:hypothetical protein
VFLLFQIQKIVEEHLQNRAMYRHNLKPLLLEVIDEYLEENYSKKSIMYKIKHCTESGSNRFTAVISWRDVFHELEYRAYYLSLFCLFPKKSHINTDKFLKLEKKYIRKADDYSLLRLVEESNKYNEYLKFGIDNGLKINLFSDHGYSVGITFDWSDIYKID